MNKLLQKIMLASLVIMPTMAFAAQRAGEVISVLGEPEVKQSDATKWQTLAMGDDVFVGDKIRTKDGKAKILLVDDTVLTLDVNTRLGISKHMFRPKEKKRSGMFSLWSGRVKALVGSFFGDSDVRIKTPTAVAGVRGTHFVVEVIPPKTAQAGDDEEGPGNDAGPDPALLGKTIVKVLEGLVQLQNSAGSLDIGEMMVGGLDAAGVAESLREMSPAEVLEIKTSINFRSLGQASKNGRDAGNKGAGGALNDPSTGDSGGASGGDGGSGGDGAGGDGTGGTGGDSGDDPLDGAEDGDVGNDVPPADQESFDPSTGGKIRLNIVVPNGRGL